MSHFDRHLPTRAVDRLDKSISEHAWFADLLRRWRPAGSELQASGLRLAVRNGYLNFYRYGQSIAKVSFDRQGIPRADTHQKYLQDGLPDQRYARLSGSIWNGLESPKSFAPDDFDQCIRRVDENYAGDEKRFVEAVIGRNADVIDIEMGLPASSTGPKIAPRIDLVSFEWDGGELRHPLLVFWEAKLVGDGRMRRRDEKMPEVVRQLSDYSDWLARPEVGIANLERVRSAYASCCKLLVRLRAGAVSAGIEVPELGRLIETLATDARFAVDENPRLLVDNRRGDASFERHGHYAKLQNAPKRILIQLVQSDDDLRLVNFDDLRAFSKPRATA